MLTSSTLYRQALPNPHELAVKVEVFHSGVSVATFTEDLIVDGNVQAHMTSQVTRSLSLTIDPGLYPALPTDVFAAEAAVVQVSAGIQYPNGSRELFKIFTGRVYDVDRDADGGVTLTGQDLAADVIAFPFEQPVSSLTGEPITTEIQRLIRQAIPGALFGTDDVTDAPVPTLVWDDERGRALDDLATAVQGRWYTLGDGSFVTRRYPYVGGTPVVSLVDQSGGVNITAKITRTRVGVPNSVTVVSERTDGTTPVRVTVRDTDAASPFRFDGPYGRVGQRIRVQTPLTAAGAQNIAQARLMAGRALNEQWQISSVPDYTLEPADTIAATYRGVSANQVIDSITWPLVTGNAMTLACRSSLAA
jgi:hypothetical protein